MPLALLPLLQQVAHHVSRQQTLLSHLHEGWAYVMLGGTSIITEEAAPIIGGLAAHDGHLAAATVAMACGLGSWLAGIGLYFVGRWRGTWVRQRWPRAGRFIRRALALVRRRPWRAAIAVRYAFGLRIALPIACGAARLPLWLYLIGSGIGAFTWAALFTALGWGFGETALHVLGHVRQYEDEFALGIIVLGLIGFVILHRRNRVSREVEQVVDTMVAGKDAAKAVEPEARSGAEPEARSGTD